MTKGKSNSEKENMTKYRWSIFIRVRTITKQTKVFNVGCEPVTSHVALRFLCEPLETVAQPNTGCWNREEMSYLIG